MIRYNENVRFQRDWITGKNRYPPVSRAKKPALFFHSVCCIKIKFINISTILSTLSTTSCANINVKIDKKKRRFPPPTLIIFSFLSDCLKLQPELLSNCFCPYWYRSGWLHVFWETSESEILCIRWRILRSQIRRGIHAFWFPRFFQFQFLSRTFFTLLVLNVEWDFNIWSNHCENYIFNSEFTWIRPLVQSFYLRTPADECRFSFYLINFLCFFNVFFHEWYLLCMNNQQQHGSHIKRIP